MSPDVILKFDGGYLRPLKITDIYTGHVSGLNDPEVNRYLDEVKRNKQTTQSVHDFVKTNELSTNSILWGVWQENSEKYCGTIRLHSIEHYHKTAHIGVCLFDKTVWGKHLGKKAISIVTQWAIDVLGLRWIEAGAYTENIASQRVFLSAGYSWVFDIPGKYIFEEKPTTVKVFAAKKQFMTAKQFDY